MAEVLGQISSWLSLLSRISLGSILEAGITSFLAYEILFWIKNTRAWNLSGGFAVILIFVAFAAMLHLAIVLWIIKDAATIAVAVLLVIFQPELRKALEQLGSHNILPNTLSFDEGKENQNSNDKTINELVEATFEMTKAKAGVLMAIERGFSLKEIERMGIEINGLVTSQLLINIFEHNTPLHDGVVVVRGNRITMAICYLLLSDNMIVSKDLGIRHRAVVGVNEVTDSVTTVISKGAGRVLVAAEGYLVGISDAEGLKNALSSTKEESVSLNCLKLWEGRLENGKKAV